MGAPAETWIDIEGYEGIYQISNTGKVKSLQREKWNGNGYQAIPERILKEVIINTGYNSVSLWKNGKGKAHLVHRLIGKHFLDTYTESLDINHIDGIKTNNTLDNLEVCTRKENINHAFRIGLSNNNHSRKKVINTKTNEQYNCAADALKSLDNIYCLGYFRHMLQGVHQNKTVFEYAN